METTYRSVVAIEHYRALRRRAISAAFVARQRKHTSAPHRQLPRARVPLPLTLQFNEWETDTWTVDLSAGGFSFLASTAPVEEQFPFSMQLKTDFSLRGLAHVVAIVPRGNQFFVCARFTSLGQREAIVLEDFVIDALLQADSHRARD